MNKKECFSSWLPLNWDIGLLLPLAQIQTGIYTIGSSASWAFELEMQLYCGFPLDLQLINLWFLGLVSLYNVTKQFLIIPFNPWLYISYLSVYLSVCLCIISSYWSCFSGEPRLIDQALLWSWGSTWLDWRCSPGSWKEGKGLLLFITQASGWLSLRLDPAQTPALVSVLPAQGGA